MYEPPFPNESEEALSAVEHVIRAAPTRRRKNFFERHIVPLRGDSRRARRRKLSFDFLLLVMAASASVIIWWVSDHFRNPVEQHTDLIQAIVTERQEDNEGQEVEVPREKKQVILSADKFKEINNEYVGFLSAPGGNIRLPIVQTRNNNYYLLRDFYLKPSRYGNPFMDFNNRLEPVSPNLVIYGHHMKDGSIFSKLTNYRQRDTVAKYPLITFELANGQSNQYKIFAVVLVNGKPKDDNGYAFAVNTTDFSSREKFEGYVKQLLECSLIKTPVEVAYGDKLMTLQTCVYDIDGAFLYVIGRQLRPGEDASVDTSQIKKNPNPRLPQKLCDKWNTSNSFKNAARWVP